jgi:hypothetical protein
MIKISVIVLTYHHHKLLDLIYMKLVSQGMRPHEKSQQTWCSTQYENTTFMNARFGNNELGRRWKEAATEHLMVSFQHFIEKQVKL